MQGYSFLRDIGILLLIWWLTHTVQRLQPYYQLLQLSATKLTHAAHSIISHETPTIAPTNWQTINDLQIQSLAFKMKPP